MFIDAVSRRPRPPSGRSMFIDRFDESPRLSVKWVIHRAMERVIRPTDVYMALLAEGGTSGHGVYKHGPPDGGRTVTSRTYKHGPPDGGRDVGSRLAPINIALLAEGAVVNSSGPLK